MTFLLFIAVIAFGATAVTLLRRLRTLEARVDDLEGRAFIPQAEPEPLAERPPAVVVRSVAQVVRPAPAITAPPKPLPAPPHHDDPIPPPARERLGFEAIVGGKLPIWIGGAALVLSAFFLVRFSIENGLLGPVARTVTAAIFGAVLVAVSEVARRLPATRTDPRIGQALAGAGIAIFYGTLYIGAALYDLIGDGTAFVLMIAVTGGALVLALRHGPPTAIMALIGGFSAPLVAGFDSAGIGPLLAYLGLLVAALFGLAIRRGWVWLALAACGGGFAWVNLLIASVEAHDLAGVGGFVLLLAIGATLALPRTGAARRWLRMLPLVAGLVQLLILAPALDFGPLAWGLYLLLGAATLWLGWRDEALAPGAAAALALVLLLLAVALRHGGGPAPYAAIAITLLWAIPGQLRAMRDRLWAGIALAATACPVLLVIAWQHAVLPPALWALLLLAAAAASASLAWRARNTGNEARSATLQLTGASAIAALLAGAAIAELTPTPWRWAAWLLLGVALAAWARRTRDGGIALLAATPAIAAGMGALTEPDRLLDYIASVTRAAPAPPLADLLALGLIPALLLAITARLLPDRRQPRAVLEWAAFLLALAFIPATLPAPWHAAGLGLATFAAFFRLSDGKIAVAALATLAAAVPVLGKLFILVAMSLSGDRLTYPMLPAIADLLRELALPAALIAAGLTLRRDALGRARGRVIAALAVAAVATAYALAKQPLAIATPPAFESWGFTERAMLTQAVFAASFALRTRAPRLAGALRAFALARFVWFDLLILDPMLVRQSVGAIPLLNLATFHTALVALWLWPLRASPRWRSAMLVATGLAVAATVRQATHGTFLTGPIDRTENWLYSAAFLALAVSWLVRGMRTGAADLRVAGLALLTAVTLKVFLIDASALAGILRILSFLGLGLALIGIGWAYGRVMARAAPV